MKCSCAHNSDGTVTTILCPSHADTDPCLTMARVTGRRRHGSIVRGVCSACGWRPTPSYRFEPTSSRLHVGAVSIMRELGDDERDEEVGRMFEVRYNDGKTAHAFADELTEIAS